MAVAILEVLYALVLTVYHVLERLVKIFVPQKMLEKNISGQVVLVTGGGSGIGRLMCLRYARLGATVVTWDINKLGNEETVEMVKKEGNRAFSYTVDMSSKDDIYRVAEKTKEDVGPVTILVNNAGIVSGSALMDTPDAKIVKTFEVNVLAHFWTIKAFLPDMIKHKLGHIVNVASLAGHSGTNKLVDYCSSKFAAVGLDEALRVELFVQGHSDYIKTTVVCPYYISTGMFAGVQSKLIPILVPEYVADSVVGATLTNREVLLLPWWSFMLIALKAILPEPAFMRLSQAFGFNCSMDQFEGRTKKE
eukprot:TRINITY_DN19909_c0_g1_i1.p1 TRINITY_DN19909_c0_g1~~TRINITY_DN19909_c0_g1_i1.p1  ORF type:complete len:306 (-),score=78.86 TRINITY_DN19909_c0_g1_i1:145-1062(-)